MAERLSTIKQVGFEIEGGWDGDPGVKPIPGPGQFTADHSINGQSIGDSQAIRATHVGEAISPPLAYESPVWKEWILANWPTATPPNRTNRTCGFHIHLSTYNLKQYSMMTSKSLLYQIHSNLEAMGKELKLPPRHIFWQRMNGLNRFCRFDFDPQQQMEVTMDNRNNNATRYGYLNFSWKLHGTAEFRVLPTFRDGFIALRFAEIYFATVDNFLRGAEKEEVSFTATLVG